jgi:hypothetical protein
MHRKIRYVTPHYGVDHKQEMGDTAIYLSINYTDACMYECDRVSGGKCITNFSRAQHISYNFFIFQYFKTFPSQVT